MPFGLYFNVILMDVQRVLFPKMHYKMISVKWQLFCTSLNVFKQILLHLPDVDDVVVPGVVVVVAVVVELAPAYEKC